MKQTTFLNFIRQLKIRDTPRGRFLAFALQQWDFPETDSQVKIQHYLQMHKVSDEQHQAFRELYRDWQFIHWG